MTDASKTENKTEASGETGKTAAGEEKTPTKETPEVNESMNARLSGYFNAIASSTSADAANLQINQALSLFASRDVPVIIAFYRENGQKDYDEPTTIVKYLNYLKDQKKNPNKVESVVYDDNGKIVELELTR